MGKIADYISSLKEKRRILKQLQEEEYQRRIQNDTIQFYKDSMEMGNLMDGLVIIITENSSHRGKAEKGFSHIKIVQQIFRQLGIKENFDAYPADYGDEVADEYHFVFIRACSVEAGSTIVYCPEQCSPYQIEQLKKYNEEVKEFNTMHKGHEIQLCYRVGEQEYENVHDIDFLIEAVERQSKSSRIS